MQISKQAWLNSNHLFTEAAQRKLNPMVLPLVASAATQARPDSKQSRWTFQWEGVHLAASEDELGVLTISLMEKV